MIEQKIYTVLTTSTGISALVGSRIYPIVLPQNPTYPAITYQRVGGRRFNSLNGYSELENPIIQIDVWGGTHAAVIDLGDRIITALHGSTVLKATAPNSPLDIYEDEISVYRRSIDISVWGT